MASKKLRGCLKSTPSEKRLDHRVDKKMCLHELALSQRQHLLVIFDDDREVVGIA